MKKVLLILIILISVKVFTQTFSATGLPIAENGWAAYGNISFNVPVTLGQNLTSGTIELLQVNLNYGDASQSFYTSTSTDVYLKSPNGSEYKILDGGSVNYKDVNVKLRDNSQLNKPCTKASPQPYAVGYYRTETANIFDNFLSENPDGNWIVRFHNNSSRTRPKITSIELVFGVLSEINILGTTDNDACATPQAFCEEAEIIYENVGHAGDVSADPPPTASNPCDWNNNLDNTSWFSFEATQTTAVVTISGTSGTDHQQYIVVGNSSSSNSCSAADLYTVAGGCPTDAVNNYNSLYSNGTYYNMNFNLSGLTIGETYYLITDGDGGAQSAAYLTVSGSTACNNVLPIKLKEFSGKNINTENILKWVTSSEINNDFFTIERSSDGYYWEIIDVIEGAGNSNINLNYSYRDKNIDADKIYYYRLKQTDFDNKYTYSKVISITANNNIENSFNIYPNPSDNGIFNINSDESLIVEIYNSNGSIIYNGTSNYVIDISKFGKGIYLLKAYGKNNTFAEKIIIK